MKRSEVQNLLILVLGLVFFYLLVSRRAPNTPPIVVEEPKPYLQQQPQVDHKQPVQQHEEEQSTSDNNTPKEIRKSIADFFDRSQDGKIIIPSGVTELIIDVGESNSPILPSKINEMVIGFEPVYEVSQENNGKHRARFGGRYVSISAAAADYEGYAIFGDRQADKGTSSLLDNKWDGIEESAKTRPGNAGDAFKVSNKRVVPVFRMKSLLEAIPDHVRITLLKVDAQGADCIVLKGCGDSIQRVERIRAEIAIKLQMYALACTQDEITSILQPHKFKFDKLVKDPEGYEGDIEFVRN